MRPDDPPPSLGPCSERATRAALAFARFCAGFSIAVGLIVLLGWVVGSPVLAGAIGVPITVKANTAVGFVLAGTALALALVPRDSARTTSRVLGAAIALLGGLTLSQHLTGIDLGIDQILFTEPEGAAATASPGRMGPPSSTNLLVLGVCLAFLDRSTRRGRKPFRHLPLVVTVIALTSLLGYLFGSSELYSAARVTGIAWPTAITLLLLSLGTVLARPDGELVRVVCAENLGGAVARLLLIPSVVVPILVLLVYGEARDVGLLQASLARALVAVTMVVAMSAIVLMAARRLCVAAEAHARAQEQIRARTDELAGFFESSVVGIVWIARDGRITMANRAMLALLWQPREEVVGHELREFCVDADEADALIARLDDAAAPRDYPLRIRTRAGEVKHVLLDSSVHRDGGAALARCFVRDVSDSHEADLLQHRLSAIVESSNDAIVSKDLGGIVQSWNRAAERMFGYTAAEIVGRPITTIIPPELHAQEREILESIRAGEMVHIFDTIRRRKDGRELHVSLSVSPVLDAAGRVVGASKIARDITERRQADAEREQLLESERAARGAAERAARLRDEFLAIVSHELRTPLNGILGWAQFLKRSELEDRTVRDAVEAIERGARTQAQLIEDLLDMNRIMGGRLALDLTVVDLAAVVQAATATVRPAIESKQIALRVLLGRTGPVTGDPVRLQQVVWNILSNAVKFTPKKGRIDVMLRQVDSRAEITIRDTGQGIEPSFLPYVFDRFRQADASTTRAHGGLGLGLSIVKHLVELHGGDVTAESAGEDQGSTFCVTLPLSPLREGGQARPHSSDSSSADEISLQDVRVLVVDDDQDARELLQRILQSCGAEVTIASSAVEAIRSLSKDRYEVLVSDIGMPTTDGYQLIRTIREDLKLDPNALPAVALTAYARSEDRTRAMLAGYQTHIAKPVEPRELVATVASFVRRTPPGEA